MSGIHHHVCCTLVLVVSHVIESCTPDPGETASNVDSGPVIAGGALVVGINPNSGAVIKGLNLEPGRDRRSIPTYVRRLSPGYMFGVMDEDSNDFIDAIEWMNAGLTKKPRAFVSLLDKIDADKDEMISFEEFKDWHTRWSNGELGKGGKQGQDIQD